MTRKSKIEDLLKPGREYNTDQYGSVTLSVRHLDMLMVALADMEDFAFDFMPDLVKLMPEGFWDEWYGLAERLNIAIEKAEKGKQQVQ